MTFDEALNELEPRTIWSSEMRDLLEQLRQEYAPTIEMTQEQYDVLGELDIDTIKQVLLHPETIKIVDE